MCVFVWERGHPANKIMDNAYLNAICSKCSIVNCGYAAPMCLPTKVPRVVPLNVMYATAITHRKCKLNLRSSTVEFNFN